MFTPVMETQGQGDYLIQIWPYAYGQYRINLCLGNEHNVVRQLCTYKPDRAARVAVALKVSKRPEVFCNKLARPWNCEHPGGRIRLDNRLEDRIELRPSLRDYYA